MLSTLTITTDNISVNNSTERIFQYFLFTLLTLCDIVQNNVASVTENTALQCWTMEVDAVHIFLSGVIVKYGQITGNCGRKTWIHEYHNKRELKTKEVYSAGQETLLTVSRKATGAAAFQRGLLLVILQKLRSSPLRLLDIDENTREASNPAVFIIGGRRALRLSVAHQTQRRQQTPCDIHCA